MELAYRKGTDAFVPAGSYRELEAQLRRQSGLLEEAPAVVLSCFDRSTRLMPFVLYDKMIFPAGARVIAGALHQAGFARTRAVFQLWNPNVQPSAARIDGRPIQLLLLSTMQMHSQMAFAAIRDAWRMGADRPLILVGGPKTYHEPYHFWPMQTPTGAGGPDAVVTGEAYVLLDLLNTLMPFHRAGESLLRAFERARRARALERVPGLVYLDPEATWEEPVLVDTGLQRLVQHLDEMPHEVSGLRLMEPPHRRTGLSSAPIPDQQVGRYARIVSLLITQGCKFNCSYCPIPSLNQKTWRYRSPQGLVEQLKSVRERFGIRLFFGADDNFLNRRETAEEFFVELARTQLSSGKSLGRQVQWGTEATQFDTYKNRDLLPLARRAGLGAIWFGIEDLTAELINKGQRPDKTAEVFRLLHENKICPMAMMMFHDGQPFYTPRSLYGLANQMDFLRRAGAVSVQVTIHTPAIGTREYEKTYETGKVVDRFGDFRVSDRLIDGTHATVAGETPLWRKQLELIGGYFRFYNPINLFRALRQDGSPLRKHRIGCQVAGMLGTVFTAVKLIPYWWRLLTRPAKFHTQAPAATRVPVRPAPGAFCRFPDGLPTPRHTSEPARQQAAA
jgi:radical SAM superfamily enzyme YgiQ (UPF0313 family)